MDGFNLRGQYRYDNKVVVVIPAYNEAATIGVVVATASRYVSVLVVDDYSTDCTGNKAKAAGAMVVRNPRNLGYEATINRGFEIAIKHGFKYIITMDADGEHNPDLIKPFIDALVEGRAPVVLGVRPKKQRVSEILMGWYVSLRFGVHDILCGMKGYDAHLVFENGGFDTSYSVGTELAINSIRKGSTFIEIPVKGTQRQDKPRFDRRWRANLRILKALCRLIKVDLMHFMHNNNLIRVNK